MGIFRVISSVAALFMCMGLMASVTATEALLRMQGALSSIGPAEITFYFKAYGSPQDDQASLSGTYFVQGDCFRLETSEVKVYCDATAKWIEDIYAGEMVVMPHDPASTDITEDPFGVLLRLEPDSYSIKYGKSSGPVDGGGLYLVLKPLDKEAGYSSIELYLSREDYMPYRIIYYNRNGNVYQADITGIRPAGTLDPGMFAPADSLLETLYVTDLR